MLLEKNTKTNTKDTARFFENSVGLLRSLIAERYGKDAAPDHVTIFVGVFLRLCINNIE